MSEEKRVNLYGRIFIKGHILAKTGLHIGGSPAGLAIGSVDNPVIRDPLTNQPYIPGSSLRGKMRSLWEKAHGRKQNWPIGKGVNIHICEKLDDYNDCPVCPIYGVPGQLDASSPTRLTVRDVFMDEESAKQLRKQAQTDMPYTEVKWEAAIDRVTSAATPRQIERVPAGTKFSDFEMVFSVYEEKDLARFLDVLEAMQLLEDDYLGGSGSRGSGKIVFEGVAISARATRSKDGYGKEIIDCPASGSVSDLLDKKTEILTWLEEKIKIAKD
ncbi:MAG: type III-A CRISPR-associated RAMP protein Csm3 [Chloroflexi bacterium]|nr:MAG: type III-A CRISPR-associated RAMP protein Csm3 [Chloroflexota bacterium]